MVITGIIVAIMVPGIFIVRLIITGQQGSWLEVAMGIPFTFLVTVSIYASNMKIYYFLFNKFPWKTHTVKRLVSEFVLTSASAATIITFYMLIFYSGFDGAKTISKSENLYDHVMIALVVNFVVISIMEGKYFFREWKKSMVESEALKRQNVEFQYSALTSQLNPHFLFNSLNALSSLIPVDPEKAVEFNQKFSKIYRYVLEVKDKEIIELADELTFLKNYFFLQKIRYGHNITLNINMGEKNLEDHLPPLSLQLLLENAIKHNEISAANPLKIELYNEGNFLIMKNNYQPKEDDVKSTGMGLINLQERYSFYTDIPPLFFHENGYYIVKLPLLKVQ
jgi:sensor histidine kinase YesM